MRIAFLNMPIEYYSPVSGGAIATIIAQTGRELIARGHEVSVLTPVNQDPTYDVGRVVPLGVKRRDDLSFVGRRLSGVRRRMHRWDWPYYEYYLRSYRRRLRQMSPIPDAVIMFNDLVSPRYVRQAVPRTQVLVWLQNEWRTNPKNVAATVAATDRILTCSQYIADWTARTHGVPAEKFTVVPSGVDLEAFRPRSRFTDRSSPLRVLFIGRIDPNKGPDIAADAVKALRDEGVDVSLTVAGGLWFYGHGGEMADPFFRSLKAKIDAVGGTYLGHVPRDQMPDVVRGHDVVCVLSRSNEPFGLVVLEAMASGCVVVASDRGGLPEACGGAAMLVNPDDLQGVISRLRSLALDANLLREQKAKSLNRAQAASWGRCAEIVEGVTMGLRGGEK